ncbi:MAG: helix-turn-helix transcriptional regulator [Actinomycetia bacterium]|nr:helix-turn-helix transcriptional regulator [Actinomycetes bacterium]
MEVTMGLTNAEIADRLHVSAGTVKAVIGHLMTKIGAPNHVELAIWAHETGRMQRSQ